MPYDPKLADRIRALLEDEPDLTERRMFGGLAFLLGGHMAVAAGSDGGLMVRVDPGASEALVARTPAERMIMRGRPLAGWLEVRPEHLDTTRRLSTWVRRGADHVRTLPPKVPASERQASRA